MKTRWMESEYINVVTYQYYYNRLVELACARFEWEGLPLTADYRFMEISLMTSGAAILLNDPVMDSLYTLKVLPNGPFDVYGYPIHRMGYGYNGVNVYCTPDDSVLVYNNLLRKGILSDLQMFAKRLYQYDRICDVNVNAQKTPVLIVCDENEKRSMQNVYTMFDGNEQVIWGTKKFNADNVKVLKTEAPFVADKVNALKNNVWNEALTYLGIYNSDIKGHNATALEMQRSQGGTIASRFSPLIMRQKACELANDMWGLNLSCKFRSPDEYADLLSTPEDGIVDNNVEIVEDEA